MYTPGGLGFIDVNEAAVWIDQVLDLGLVRVKDADLPIQDQIKTIEFVHSFENPVARLKFFHLEGFGDVKLVLHCELVHFFHETHAFKQF